MTLTRIRDRGSSPYQHRNERRFFDEVAQAIAVVDLDSDSVIYTGPLLSALSTGSVRDRALRKLDRALGNVGTIGSVSHSIIQAFPNGKFVPFSQVEIDGEIVEAERLGPEPSWNVSDCLFSLTTLAEKRLPRSGTRTSSSRLWTKFSVDIRGGA